MEIEVSSIASLISSQMLASRAISEERKQQIFETTKYNVVAKAFNGSTILLIAALAAAIFFAYTTAFVWGSISLFVRSVTLEELEKYQAPFFRQMPKQDAADDAAAAAAIVLARWSQLRMVAHALKQSTKEEKIRNIFIKTGAKQLEKGWIPAHTIFDRPIWFNELSEPQS